MRDTYHTLQDIQTQNRLSKTKDLFIHEEFNVKCFTARPLSLVRSTLARIMNALIKALDEVNKLPRLIVVLPHDDLAKFLCKGLTHDEMPTVFTKVVNSMVTSMARAVQSKKDSLIARKPGAVSSSEPKFIWGRMLCGSTANMQFLSQTFNNALNNSLAKQKGHYIMDVEKEMNLSIHKGIYDVLTREGIGKYWREVNRIIKRFEFGEISLRPFVPDQRKSKFYKDNRTSAHKS